MISEYIVPSIHSHFIQFLEIYNFLNLPKSCDMFGLMFCELPIFPAGRQLFLYSSVHT